jgi:hypothetical protein
MFSLKVDINKEAFGGNAQNRTGIQGFGDKTRNEDV